MLKECIRIFPLILILGFFNNAYAAQSQVSNAQASIQNLASANESGEVLNYIDRKLIDAGFSKDTRDYVLGISKARVSSVSDLSLQEKKELINKNIYSLIENLNIENQKSSSLLSEQLNKTNQYERPWDCLLTSERLNLFKSQSVFGAVSVGEMKKVTNGICPIWPFCGNPAPDKGDKKKKKGGCNGS